MVTYETERLILSSPRPEHEAELLKLHNDPRVQEVIFNNVPQTLEDVRKWLDWFWARWHKNGFGDWMVYEKTDEGPIFIGRSGLRDYDGTNNLELVTVLAEHGRRRGLGLEARRFGVTHALQNSTKEKVVSVIRHGNVPAERAAKKLGLRYVDDRWYQGKFWQYYEMTRQEYFVQPHHQVTGKRGYTCTGRVV
ncbi:GNAT family N-acetyltransferase [Bradyrhizobium sp. Gha]|uniref:GNAT family N-acetyltransferase n=1 Tax=Bradyrhizobium sp. Gha TaxID=1855318 RepID=UPI0008DFA2D4|nr:GNAT family N-acetyltransferase [Bradyrhizobium sp. Gha]SFK30338.1 Protein N-acetyltransferase, RimJ/RimL family [Bradyrhizobium sp. Gha]